MNDILEELTAARRADAAEREKEIPFGEMVRRAREASPARGFARAISRPGTNIIAELKRASPSEGSVLFDIYFDAFIRKTAASDRYAVF